MTNNKPREAGDNTPFRVGFHHINSGKSHNQAREILQRMIIENKLKIEFIDCDWNKLTQAQQEIEALKKALDVAVEALEYVVADKIWPIIEAKKALAEIRKISGEL